MEIEGLKLIRKTGAVDIADDPSYPFKLEASFRLGDFMLGAAVSLGIAGEELVVRGMTEEALVKLVEVNDLRTHPRLRWLKITGQDGAIVDEVRAA